MWNAEGRPVLLKTGVPERVCVCVCSENDQEIVINFLSLLRAQTAASASDLVILL